MRLGTVIDRGFSSERRKDRDHVVTRELRLEFEQNFTDAIAHFTEAIAKKM